MKTEGYFLKSYGSAAEAFALRSFELAEPKGNEVMLAVDSFGLNYADVMARNKLYREAPPLPCILGYEVVGTVIAAGAEANPELIGKRVVAFTRFGAYSKHVLTPDYACMPIEGLTDHQALSLATQYVTAYYMAVYHSPVRAHEKVLIHAAAGGVGLALIQLCRQAGAEVVAKVSTDEKVTYLREMGLQHIINYKKQDYPTEAAKMAGNRRFDVIFNPVAGSTFKSDMRLLGSGGRLVLFGGSDRLGKRWGILSTLNFVRKMGLMLPIGLMMRSKSVIGINMLKVADFHPEVLRHCLAEVCRMAQEGSLQPPAGKTFRHDQLAEAHHLLESGKSIGKIALQW